MADVLRLSEFTPAELARRQTWLDLEEKRLELKKDLENASAHALGLTEAVASFWLKHRDGDPIRLAPLLDDMTASAQEYALAWRRYGEHLHKMERKR